MKYILYIIFGLLLSNKLKAQIVTYAELLCTADEIIFEDSISFSDCPNSATMLDNELVKQVFAPIYHTAGKSWGDKLSWSLVGKISRFPNYDLLLLFEKNEGKPGQFYNTLHLVSLNKEGKYIASFGLYIHKSSGHSSYQTSSLLYSNFAILQQTKVRAGLRNFGGSHFYKLNAEGFFENIAKN